MSRATRLFVLRPTRLFVLRPTRLFVLLLASLAAFTACATGPFAMRSHPSRAEAIQRCTKEVPADAVPYADAMADCMERYGWTYQAPPRAAEG
jgi:hypothetical protein